MKIILDTNIVFSALLNTRGTIGDLLLNSAPVFDFTVASTCATRFSATGPSC